MPWVVCSSLIWPGIKLVPLIAAPEALACATATGRQACSGGPNISCKQRRLLLWQRVALHERGRAFELRQRQAPCELSLQLWLLAACALGGLDVAAQDGLLRGLLEVVLGHNGLRDCAHGQCELLCGKLGFMRTGRQGPQSAEHSFSAHREALGKQFQRIRQRIHLRGWAGRLHGEQRVLGLRRKLVQAACCGVAEPGTEAVEECHAADGHADNVEPRSREYEVLGMALLREMLEEAL
mmetsp:Transcript_74778/g.173196  ORF Transcript_74778/g.173196 Transcript_74778/m.173196 type:complete len:238 (-) Transcript_74778:1236-1949(-)